LDRERSLATVVRLMYRLIMALVASLLAIVQAYPQIALAGPEVDPALGYDVSYLDCDAVLPSTFGFAVVNVNHGRPYTANPCFADQVAWALTGASTIQPALSFYINTSNPGPSASRRWPGESTGAPEPCDGSWSFACAYNFGWLAAQEAFDRAALVVGADDAASRHWWLDVETENSWSEDHALNTVVLLGNVGGLQSRGVGQIGIYATRAHWAEITGATSPESRINAPFADMPNWIPRLGPIDDAVQYCSPAHSLTGGPIQLVQFEFFLDRNYACSAA
jgi:hypothetical protein